MSSDILSGILSVISSDILSDILSGILSGRSSDILSGISSGILFVISSDILPVIEGSLEVKLPTICRDGKAEVGRVSVGSQEVKR